MNSHRYRYQIVRYIPDLRRMEPQNIGIIVQSEHAVTCRFHTHLGNKAGFDFDNYRLWREFFRAEIQGQSVELFQPERTSIRFLEYLRSRCRGNYSLTSPLELVMETDDLSEVEAHLFRTLVHAPEEKEESSFQPVKVFQGELERRKIIKSPFLKYNQPFALSDSVEELVQYHYTRNHGADLPVIIQPVRWLNSIQATLGGIAQAEKLVESIKAANVRAEINVVLDDFASVSEMRRAKEKDAEGWRWVKRRLDEAKRELEPKVDELVDDAKGAVQLADTVERDINDLETAAKQPELSLDAAK